MLEVLLFVLSSEKRGKKHRLLEERAEELGASPALGSHAWIRAHCLDRDKLLEQIHERISLHQTRCCCVWSQSDEDKELEGIKEKVINKQISVETFLGM